MSVASSAALAVLVTGVFLWSGFGKPLPAFGWAAVFLFLVVEEDVRRRRIPNWLTLPCLGVAIGLGIWMGGWSGGTAAILGTATAFGLLFPVFLLRGIGAGDVKALMVLGALWGPADLLGGLWWMVLIGGAMGLGAATIRSGSREVIQRWALTAWTSWATRRWTYFGASSCGGVESGIPFGVAIALGASCYQLWGIPWI